MKVLITGATSGFGKAIAEKFALPGNELWITGRRTERLDALQQDLQQNGIIVKTTGLDVRDKQSVNALAAAVEQEWHGVDVLVNNAGLALGANSIDEGDTEDWDDMIDTNIKGLLYVTRAIAPLMRRQRSGHIINIGSTAGKVVYQNGNVYCATKFAVDAISQSTRIDLLPHRIKVTSINPGMAETEFSLVRFKGDGAKAGQVYNGFEALRAEDIADTVYYCATLPPHVCINDLTITCTQQANSIYKAGN
ncbi:SDR family NAD(P)-dependent oxidoreductase [Taibaiella koreensis]|uniref:SDR family NAD(P)-dependent oxidoreductase n=1 Tax=Taibaiella koreensis TaxID=1268548 RepID=UPI000E59AB36|nr:SDR family NAD(P)-dependent oxidoreductase [Taibaiella koreensis]